MNVLCRHCARPLAAGEAMILHDSHRTFHWLCEEDWKRKQFKGAYLLEREHAAAMARARHAAVIPREETT